MSWLTTDLNLLATDTEQLRLHLGWLVEDLAAHRANLNGQAHAVDELAAQLTDCLGRLDHLAAVMGQVRAVVAER